MQHVASLSTFVGLFLKKYFCGSLSNDAGNMSCIHQTIQFVYPSSFGGHSGDPIHSDFNSCATSEHTI